MSNGNHYRTMIYQPVDFIEDIDLGFILGSAVNLVCSFDKKGGNEDLLKAIDYLERCLKRYGENPASHSDSSMSQARRFLRQFNGFQYDALFEMLSGRFGEAILVIKSQMYGVFNEGEKIELIKQVIHYPECWDTIAFPTLLDAVKELDGGCHEDHCPKKQEDSDQSSAKEDKREIDQILFGDK